MEQLELYLRGDYLDEKQELQKVHDLIREIIPVFGNFFSKTYDCWPYELSNKEPVTIPKRFSFSTNAMILFALGVACGKVQSSVLVPAVRHQYDWVSQTSTEKLIHRGLDRLIGKSMALGRVVTESGTFGDDDPFTLTWLIELVQNLGGDVSPYSSRQSRFKTRLVSHAASISNRALSDPTQASLRLARDKQSLRHTFPLLRIVHLSEALDPLRKGTVLNADAMEQFLKDCLYLQLSHFSIPNSSFDAAELVFALEGVLLCNSNALDEALVLRCFEIVSESQKRNPYWRPLRPFICTSQGMALLPLSVEIANSLLRVSNRLDAKRIRDSVFSEHLHLFKNYTDWLFSRLVRACTKDNRPFVGWHSEHIYAPDRIHLWETSQVLLYLMHYAALLQQHIARRSLQAAQFHAIAESRRDAKSPVDYWKSKAEPREPLKSAVRSSFYRVYRRIREDYIETRDRKSLTKKDGHRAEKHYSMLLYGPPGTGKTAAVESLAKALKYRLVLISPSDFITRGESGVEARAKAIFDTLSEQADAVILFDEIDRLILDRDSSLYENQSDIFRFMTPGMLTKLKDLRARENAIFVIATNYAERIDTAAKRVGRIDDQYLLLPPDGLQRREILLKLIKTHEGPAAISPIRKHINELDEAVRATALATFGELEQLVSRAARRGIEKGTGLGAQLVHEASSFRPQISLLSYRSRFSTDGGDSNTAQIPVEEFLLVAYLVLESGRTLDDEEKALVADVLKRVSESGKTLDKIVLDKRIRRSLEKFSKTVK